MAAPFSAESGPPTGLRRVLVVEDDAVNRAFIRITLERCGYQVLPVQNVRIAQQEFNIRGREHFDCVISDSALSDSTGLDLLRWLKGEDASLSTIVLAADGERQFVAEALRLGATDLLEKPVDASKLQAAVERAVSQTKHQRRLIESESAVENLGRAQRWMMHSVEKQFLDLCFHPKFEAGGDFLAHFQIAPGAFGCLVTDVSGHDPQAAYISAYFHGVFRGMTLGATPMTTIFKYFNKFLVDEWNREEKLRQGYASSISVAAMALLIDSESKSANLLNCGAPAPVQVFPDGRASWMCEDGGPPLGWFPNIEIKASVYPIAGGGTVYLWTDGLADLSETHEVHPLSMAFALQQAKDELTAHPALKLANDDVLCAAVYLPDGNLEVGLLQPLILEFYQGDQEGMIDDLIAYWRRCLKTALPNLTDELEYNVLIATREAVINAMKHGCRGQADKKVRFQLSYHRLEHFLRVWIEDPGEGHQFDVKTKAGNLAHQLSDEHHGLIFITNLAQNAVFERNGATVILDFKL